MSSFPSPGEKFEGRYEIGGIIGTGGFARVYRAKQIDLGRDVAIKIMTPATNESGSVYTEKVVRRFNQEARLVSQLRDPHTITMFDYGRTEGGLLYMVFEYIDGRSIAEVVAATGALSYPRVLSILEQTLRSLEEAHAFGVMHRDIKPGNIMVFDHIGRADQTKLLDFGIAKVKKQAGSHSADLTADGALVGTPRYMSPEQIRGEELTAQSDIYSLGLVAYEMLVGEKAIAATSSVTIIGMQLDRRPFQLPESIDVPHGVRRIVEKMMAKDKELRYLTAKEVIEDLGTWDSVLEFDSQTLDFDEIEIDTEPSEPSEVENRRPPWLFAIAAIALLAFAAVGLVVWQSGTEVSAENTVAVAPIKQPNVFEIMTKQDMVPSPMVTVNGMAYGAAPVSLDDTRVAFPITVEMSWRGETQKRVVEAFDETIAFDFAEAIDKQNAAELAEALTQKTKKAEADKAIETEKPAVKKKKKKKRPVKKKTVIKKEPKKTEPRKVVVPAVP